MQPNALEAIRTVQVERIFLSPNFNEYKVSDLECNDKT